MKHTIETKTYYFDTDAEGVVYYANYLKWMEMGRTELLESKGINLIELREKEGLVFPVKNLSISYHAPAKLYDAVIIETELEGIKGVRFPFKQRILKKQGQILLVEGTLELAAVDRASLKPKRLPDYLKKLDLKN